MQRQKVTSKFIHSVGYDPVTQVMEVQLLQSKPGGPRRVYQYLDVPPEKWEMFNKADSKGGYFLIFIRPNHIVKRMEDADEETETKTPAAPQD
jgi:KTSC domain